MNPVRIRCCIAAVDQNGQQCAPDSLGACPECVGAWDPWRTVSLTITSISPADLSRAETRLLRNETWRLRGAGAGGPGPALNQHPWSRVRAGTSHHEKPAPPATSRTFRHCPLRPGKCQDQNYTSPHQTMPLQTAVGPHREVVARCGSASGKCHHPGRRSTPVTTAPRRRPSSHAPGPVATSGVSCQLPRAPYRAMGQWRVVSPARKTSDRSQLCGHVRSARNAGRLRHQALVRSWVLFPQATLYLKW
jgi:hypothetical protein